MADGYTVARSCYTNFVTGPKCYINGIEKPSSRESTISFSTPEIASVLHSLLNSTIFYFIYQVESNCRDLNPSDIANFCIPGSMVADNRLLLLSDKLHENQQRHSHFIIRNQQATGKVRIQSFEPTASKPIIDEIDAVLAEHFGFTAEELDFIINYDIKYRMGADAADGDE